MLAGALWSCLCSSFYQFLLHFIFKTGCRAEWTFGLHNYSCSSVFSALTAPETRNFFQKPLTFSNFLSQMAYFCNCKSAVYVFPTVPLQRGFMNMPNLTAAQSYRDHSRSPAQCCGNTNTRYGQIKEKPRELY